MTSARKFPQAEHEDVAGKSKKIYDDIQAVLRIGRVALASVSECACRLVLSVGDTRADRPAMHIPTVHLERYYRHNPTTAGARIGPVPNFATPRKDK